MYYETLMLARTQATNDELLNLEKHLDKVVNKAKGKLTLFDKWGKYKLAYPIKKNIYGLYILVRYELPKESVTELFKELSLLFKIKYNDIIIRHVSVKLPQKPSTIYTKPEPISSRGTSSLDSFLKDNKMESLIDKPKDQKPSEEKVEKAGTKEEAPKEKIASTDSVEPKSTEKAEKVELPVEEKKEESTDKDNE
jgi:small subunit ribosomal protein S6